MEQWYLIFCFQNTETSQRNCDTSVCIFEVIFVKLVTLTAVENACFLDMLYINILSQEFQIAVK